MVPVGLPRALEAQPFYRAGRNRYDDAELLFHQKRYTGAVYLAGYGVECMLKALILSVVPKAGRTAMVSNFRGRKAHDYEWLKWQLSKYWKGGTPAELSTHFSHVKVWSTDIRYDSTMFRYSHAKMFLDSAAEIIKWIDGRLS
jgi:HEPN domain